MKRIGSTILIVLFFLVGLCLLFYPTVSNWYNEQVGSYAMANYYQLVEGNDEETIETMFAAATEYNATLAQTLETAAISSVFISGEAEDETYINTLNIIDGMMATLAIEKLNLTLPVYHGTDEPVLQKGVGHLEGSALPLGEVGAHTVLTGHTGLPSATLLTNLDQMVIGDTFTVTVLDQVFTYQVFDIVVVDPDDIDDLAPIEGKSVVTLITCTPYGVNSHRLLVQGELIDQSTVEVASLTNTTVTQEAAVTAQGFGAQVLAFVTAEPLLSVAIALGAIFIVILLWPRRRKQKRTAPERPAETRAEQAGRNYAAVLAARKAEAKGGRRQSQAAQEAAFERRKAEAKRDAQRSNTSTDASVRAATTMNAANVEHTVPVHVADAAPARTLHMPVGTTDVATDTMDAAARARMKARAGAKFSEAREAKQKSGATAKPNAAAKTNDTAKTNATAKPNAAAKSSVAAKPSIVTNPSVKAEPSTAANRTPSATENATVKRPQPSTHRHQVQSAKREEQRAGRHRYTTRKEARARKRGKH